MRCKSTNRGWQTLINIRNNRGLFVKIDWLTECSLAIVGQCRAWNGEVIDGLFGSRGGPSSKLGLYWACSWFWFLRWLPAAAPDKFGNKGLRSMQLISLEACSVFWLGSICLWSRVFTSICWRSFSQLSFWGDLGGCKICVIFNVMG